MNQFIKRRKDQIVIAIPSKGRLKEHVLNFLNAKGLPVAPPEGRQLQTCLKNDPNALVVFIHPRDIALMLHEEIIDVGFTGLDLIEETKVKIRPVIRLNCGKVKMSLLIPNESSSYHPFHLLHKSVATPFPNLARAYFDRLKVEVNIRPIQGASEGMPYLGIVDGIVDVVETGSSAIENGLKIIANDLFDSECVASVNKPETKSNYPLVNQFLRKIYI
jgi:ATP phosphoribosyltransferase